MPLEQRTLDFSAAEMQYADRQNLLAIALQRAECDLFLARLCLWIFNTTDGGLAGELKKSYEELAARPYGLCCSRSKARSTVAQAKFLGLITVAEERYRSFGQTSNAYALDWAAIHSFVHGPKKRHSLEGLPGVSTEHGGVSTEHGGVSTEHGGVSTEHPFKEITFSLPSLERKELRTGPAPAAAAAGPRFEKLKQQELYDAVVGEVPELREALGRRIAPLPPNSLVYGGAFAPIERRHLDNPRVMVEWFRRQLSLGEPVMGGTEADLLLTLAASIHATRLPDADVKRNRVAVFVATLARGRWRDAARYVQDARRLLDELAARYAESEVFSGLYATGASATV
jgi:hypothetical protein